MNIYSSPLDLYLASASQLNAQKNPASFMPSAPFMSQLDPLSQQKYFSLLSSRQQQQAERLNDPNLYTYDPMKKIKTEHHSSNLTAASNAYSQEVPSQERELSYKLTNHNGLNYSTFSAAGSFDQMKNNQPPQRAFPSQQHVQEQKNSFIALDSDDEDCVIVEKQPAAALTIPPPKLNYQNMNLPPSFSDFISKSHFHNNNNNFNRTPQFHPPTHPFTHHQNNMYHNRPYAGVASLQGYETTMPNNFNMRNASQKEKDAIVIEEEDDSSHTTANSSANDSRLTLPGYQNNYYLQQMLNSRFHMPPQMHPQMQMPHHMAFQNQLANMKHMWGQQQMMQSFMKLNSQNQSQSQSQNQSFHQNDLKIITKVEEKEPKEAKEKKKPKKKPRSPKRVERKLEIHIGPENMQADTNFDEPYVIELHIDPNDPNPNVCDTMVGDEYQTNIPQLVLNKGIVSQRREIRCRWNPDTFDREKLLGFFDSLEKRTDFEITSEIAKLRLLKDNEYDVEKSLEEVDRNLIYYKGILKLTKRRGRRSK